MSLILLEIFSLTRKLTLESIKIRARITTNTGKMISTKFTLLRQATKCIIWMLFQLKDKKRKRCDLNVKIIKQNLRAAQ